MNKISPEQILVKPELQSTPPFPSAVPRWSVSVNDETRRSSVLIAAAIFAARALSDWDGKRSPRAVAAVANGIEKARLLVSILEAKG